MQTTAKPKGLAKIWREMTRPFGQLLARILQTDMGVYAIQMALSNPDFVEKILDSKSTCHWFPDNQKTWDDFFRNKPHELRDLESRLVVTMDPLSREVVARSIARRRFCMEYGDNSVWNFLQQCVWRSLYPLDYEEQERIKAIGKAYKCPYKLPHDCTEHMATGFSMNQFPPEIQKRVTGKDVIDGGGFSGDSAMVLSEYGPKRVHTFEPNPDSVSGMKRVIMENKTVLGDRKDKINIVPLALGRAKGTSTLHSSSNEFDGGGTILPIGHGKRTFQVGVISIDEFAQQHDLDVGLIKLDVEGVEYDTILGAKETITKQKPLLIISIYHTFKDFFEIKPLIESWGMGYQFEIRQHLPSVPDGEIILMAY